jgi:hypothetical protein
LRLAATFGGKLEDTRVDLRAKEAQGGPLAGALGYSPDEPFSAVAVVNADLVRAKVQTGRFVPLTVDGRFGEAGSRVSGYFDFSGSDLFAPFVERVGRTARFGFAMVPAKDKAFQGVGWKLISDNVASEARGVIRMSDRSSPDGIRLDVQTASLSRLTGADVAGPAAYSGLFKGDAQTWSLEGQPNSSLTPRPTLGRPATSRPTLPMRPSSPSSGRNAIAGWLPADPWPRSDPMNWPAAGSFEPARRNTPDGQPPAACQRNSQLNDQGTSVRLSSVRFPLSLFIIHAPTLACILPPPARL